MRNKNRTYRGAGFSLVETMIVIAVIGLFAVALPQNATAQVPAYSASGFNSLPNIPANTTSNLASPAYIDCSRSQIVGLQIQDSWSVSGSGTLTNAIYTLAPSLDGVTMDTNQMAVSITAFERKQTGNYYITNWNCGSVQGYFITAIQNTHATGILTNSYQTGQKISSP